MTEIYKQIMKSCAKFVKEKRKGANLNQVQSTERAGVVLTVIRKIEQGKGNLNLQNVNQVLTMSDMYWLPSTVKIYPVKWKTLKAK